MTRPICYKLLIPYSEKRWWWKTLANLANLPMVCQSFTLQSFVLEINITRDFELVFLGMTLKFLIIQTCFFTGLWLFPSVHSTGKLITKINRKHVRMS